MALVCRCQLVCLSKLKRTLKAGIIVAHQKNSDNNVRQRRNHKLPEQFFREFVFFQIYHQHRNHEQIGKCHRWSAPKCQCTE